MTDIIEAGSVNRDQVEAKLRSVNGKVLATAWSATATLRATTA